MRIAPPKIAIIVSVFIATSCSSHRNASLDRAEADVRNAQENQTLMARSAPLVQEASKTLEQAQDTWNNKRDRDEVEHLVYLTTRQLDMAREEARRKVALEEAALQRGKAQIAAIDMRGHTAAVERQARMSDLVAREYRAQSEETRTLLDDLNHKIEDLNAKETSRGVEFTYADSALFESGKSDLKPGAVLNFAPLVDFLSRHQDRLLIVEGHTNNMGSDSTNLELSQRRAEAVRNHFIREGVDSTRIVARGLGESYPAASNSTEAGRLHNRRVQIIVAPSRS